MSGVVLILASASDGASGIVLVGATVVSSGGGNRTAAYRVGTDGYIYHGDNGAYTQQYQWLQNGGASSSYEVKADVVTGTPSGTTGSWVSLSSNRDWSIIDLVADYTPETAYLLITIRDAGTLLELANAYITLYADEY